jgi:hypothetical protein
MKLNSSLVEAEIWSLPHKISQDAVHVNVAKQQKPIIKL